MIKPIEPKVKLYRHVEPTVAYPPSYYNEQVGFEYRGFLVDRADSEYLFYSIKTKEGGLPPRELQSNFTKTSLAIACIDLFFENEEKKDKPTDTKVIY